MSSDDPESSENTVRLELLIVARDLRQTLLWLDTDDAEHELLASIPRILDRLERIERSAEMLCSA